MEEEYKKEKEKDERSIVRLEYPPRRSCRDGREEVGGGRKGILIQVRRDTAKRARGGPGGHGRDTFVRLSPNSIGDE